MDGFNGILDIGCEEEVKIIKDKLADGKKIVSRFKGILVKMINNGGDSPKIRQIL